MPVAIEVGVVNENADVQGLLRSKKNAIIIFFFAPYKQNVGDINGR